MKPSNHVYLCRSEQGPSKGPSKGLSRDLSRDWIRVPMWTERGALAGVSAVALSGTPRKEPIRGPSKRHSTALHSITQLNTE